MSLIIPPEIVVLNDIVSAAQHCARVFRHAADNLSTGTLVEQLRTWAADREALAEGLGQVVRDQGEAPSDDGLPAEWEIFETWWTGLRAGLTGDAERVMLEFCLKAEDRLIAAVDAAETESICEQACELLAGRSDTEARTTLQELSAASS